MFMLMLVTECPTAIEDIAGGTIIAAQQLANEHSEGQGENFINFFPVLCSQV